MFFTHRALLSEKSKVHCFRLCAWKYTHFWLGAGEGRNFSPAIYLWVEEQLPGEVTEEDAVILIDVKPLEDPLLSVGIFPLDVMYRACSVPFGATGSS